MATMTATEFETFCRNDFATFAYRAFLELNPDAEFQSNWHIDLVAARLEACLQGTYNRLLVNVPPRSLKSHLASVCFPAYILGHKPNSQIICASYSQDLANKLAMDCRTLMSSQWYQRIFRTRLASHRQSVQEFVTMQNGFRLATSVGGVLTGRGADYIIIDDPLKAEEALSESQRKAVNEWYDHTLCSRLNDQRTGRKIIIMQRLHENDLVGHVLEKEQWEHIRLPAIAEEDETHVIESPYVKRVVHRKIGEPLHRERYSVEILGDVRRIIGEYNFAGQYQQQPAPLGGGLVKAKWFRSYVPGDEPSDFDLIVQSWDTANKRTELSDYSVCTTWGRKGTMLFLLDVFRQKLDYPTLKRAVWSLSCRYQPRNILIEDKASGTQLIQELREEGIYAVTRYHPQMDKIMRLHSITSTIENGRVYLPRDADWLAGYIHELTSFPNGKHDDQADSTSQALDWIKQATHRYGLHEYIKAMKRGSLQSAEWADDEALAAYEKTRSVCQKCENTGPAQTRYKYHCNQCGQEWKTVKGLNEDPKTRSCVLASGERAIWDDYTNLLVNPLTGETHALDRK
jgi:predicted phage terminase large subunit-like protein